MPSTVVTRFLLTLSFSIAMPLTLWAAPIELGAVNWTRDYESGLAAVKKSGKPMFLLFQEVPGWSGCQTFGREVLSNPKLVKLIETHFVPVAIHNNNRDPESADTRTLKKFKEPAWNYQVVRFIGADEKDIIPRDGNTWTTKAIAERMIKTLETANRPVPPDLKPLAGTE